MKNQRRVSHIQPNVVGSRYSLDGPFVPTLQEKLYSSDLHGVVSSFVFGDGELELMSSYSCELVFPLHQLEFISGEHHIFQ